jgi:hypothetical protein
MNHLRTKILLFSSKNILTVKDKSKNRQEGEQKNQNEKQKQKR